MSIAGNERQTTSRDLGLNIRECCEGLLISHFYDDAVHGCADMIDFIDVSDPPNPVFYMHSGAIFNMAIARTG